MIQFLTRLINFHPPSFHTPMNSKPHSLFQEPPMGRMDSTSESIKAIASAAEPVDRLNLLSRWIGAKLEEIAAADERIGKRLQHLNATEQSLKSLFESL